MTSDIHKVQSSFCAGGTGAAWHGEATAAEGQVLQPVRLHWGQTQAEVGEAPQRDQCQLPAASSELWLPQL